MKRAKKYHPNHPHIYGRNVVIGSDYDALAAKAERYIQEGISLADQRDALAADNQRLREALEFYARGDHFLLADPDAWDVCMGFPLNWVHDDVGTASIEDGSVAKDALAGSKESN